MDTRALYAGDGLPAEPQDYHAIIIMGGPMGVYDEAVYAFLRQEHTFLQRAITQQVPLLGICLRITIAGQALGAYVYPNACKEIGWFTQLISLLRDAAMCSFRRACLAAGVPVARGCL